MAQDTATPTDQRLRAIEHVCRGVVGDRLRSVSVDGPEGSDTCYRRSDLSPGTDESVLEAMAAGASCESPVLADGGRTVCEFAGGYVTRIQVGETSVVATTDGIKMDRDTELSAAIRGVLRG
ncbi:MAG: DUF7522 family protein [Halolamina sp.]